MAKKFRRMVVIAAAGIVAATVATWAADTTPPVVSDANRAAAVTAFNEAKDFFDQGKFTDAMRTNEQALRLDPTNSNAILLRKILRTKVSDTGTTGDTPVAAGKPRLLTDQQVSQIRLQEISPADKQVRGKVDRQVLEDFWNQILKKQEGMAMRLGAHDQFMDPSNFIGQVTQIRQSGDASFTSKVQITSDPVDMVPFKNTVHQFVLQNCATSACHGGDKGGDFRLMLPLGGKTDALVYTNFYIMAMYTAKDGGKMINRDDPELSLFLQYSLPKELAKISHPGNIAVRHFGNQNDNQFKAMSGWVKGLALPRPNYGIVFGGNGASTAPATTPTTTK